MVQSTGVQAAAGNTLLAMMKTLTSLNCCMGLYALPVYYGYLTEGQKGVLQRVLDKATSRGFTPYYYELDVLAENAQYKLFHHSCDTASVT